MDGSLCLSIPPIRKSSPVDKAKKLSWADREYMLGKKGGSKVTERLSTGRMTTSEVMWAFNRPPPPGKAHLSDAESSGGTSITRRDAQRGEPILFLMNIYRGLLLLRRTPQGGRSESCDPRAEASRNKGCLTG